MAAGREGRAERLNERLRGAQRANVDESFNLDLGGLDIPGSTSPVVEDAPSSSSRTGKQDSDAISAAAQTPGLSARRRSRRLGSKDSHDLPDSSKESPLRNVTETTPRMQDATPNDLKTARATRLSTIARSAASRRLDPIPDELETLPTPSYVRPAPQTSSSQRERMSADLIEEVEESPPSAPGSGKRRRVLASREMSNPSVRQLSVAASPDGAFPASSSPSERRVRRSESVSTRRFSASVSRLELLPEVDEINSEGPSEQLLEEHEQPQDQSGDPAIQHMEFDPESNRPVSRQENAEEEDAAEVMLESEPEPEPEPDLELEQVDQPSLEEQGQLPQDEDEEEALEEDKMEAEEEDQVDHAEKTKTSRRKRQRPPREASPELGSIPGDEAQQETQQPALKRRRPGEASPKKPPSPRKTHTKARPRTKPGKQTQPQEEQVQESLARQKLAHTTEEESVNEEARPKKPKAGRRRNGQGEDGDDGDGAIEVTVQRFIHQKWRGQEDDGIDPLHAHIPFANRGGESVVDAFAQVCDEIITSTLAQLQELANDAGDAAKKKECRIKMRAIEAYREELNSRLLQHVIHLNHWHSLRRRVRHVQKEKIALREEIIRIRSEREQVALRMDAVRIKHEADTKISKYCLDASTLMHDVDLAVEQGRDAPELSSKQQKEAELANLELLVSRIMPEATSAHSAGGMLKQVKDFNAFLERAAIALETR